MVKGQFSEVERSPWICAYFPSTRAAAVRVCMAHAAMLHTLGMHCMTIHYMMASLQLGNSLIVIFSYIHDGKSLK